MIGKEIKHEAVKKLLDLPPIVEYDLDTRDLPPPRVGLFFSMVDFGKEVRKYKSMDIMTYSCFEPPSHYPRVDRLIHCRETSYQFHRVRERRLAGNVHAKIYLCKDEKSNLQAYIGSANWMPHNEFVEVMIRVNKQQTRELFRFFNRIWKKLKKT